MCSMGEKPTPILCPGCWRRTHWCHPCQVFVCPVHGPVIAAESVFSRVHGGHT